MKFEDMKKIWNEQEQQHQYVIDEQMLQENIQLKKRKGSRIVSKMEWMMILSNLLAGSAILVINYIKPPHNIYVTILGGMMVATTVLIFIKRQHRLKNDNQFNRTMLGDLDHAIKNANYRAHLSFSMLVYFIFVSLLMIGSAFYEGKSMMQLIAITAFCVVVLFLGRWEHRSWHMANKKRLEAFRGKLLAAE